MASKTGEIKKDCLKTAEKYDGALVPYKPFENISNRSYWDNLGKDLKEWLVSMGNAALNDDYPAIYATDFMNFKRTGNRQAYEDAFFKRRYMLNSLVLAECVENKGRFLDRIIDGIFVMCEESSWALPAHNSYTRNAPQLILPDLTNPVIDLFACETGATLSMVNYLLAPSLDGISPFISQRILSELRKRIIEPYLNVHFWWMGNGDEPMCNWTPWCVQNVLITAFINDTLTDAVEKKTIFKSAAESLDLFLKDYGDDGCCDEGAQYYRHAGLCLYGALDILNAVSNNAFASVYSTDKVRNMAAYISIMHVSGPYYFNFADCSPIAGASGVREYLFGKATNQQFLIDFAASDYAKTYAEKSFLSDESQKLNLFYRTQTVFFSNEVLAASAKAPGTSYTPDIFYKSVGIWIARSKTFSVAVKAGDNDDSHNHNDVGSIILYKNGTPVLVDIGVETYTLKTFSPQRYEIWTMRSEYHNIPTINGKNELPGKDYRADNTEYCFDGPVKSISMNIEDAFENPDNITYRRTVKLDTCENTVTIKDESDAKDIVLNFISYHEPEFNASYIKLGNAVMTFDKPYDFSYEILPITDERLKIAWDHDLYRIFVKTDGPCEITIF